ncbi:CarboxypepD_reg-like domain-containing protein [bacterium A37T11]|nr:CarboxypepD_reg-like domain-containing protein [bacterium A37T11]
MRHWISILAVLICAGTVSAQQLHAKKMLQFTGIVSNADTNMVVPYVTITNLSENKQYVANYQGYFSFVAQEGDTIHFRAIGYKEQYAVIPHTTDDKYTAMIHLTPESINLPELVIHPLPWASIDEFNRYFMNMKINYDDIGLAQRNLSHESLVAMSKITPRNAQEMQTFSSIQRHIEMTNSHMNMRYANPLLSPLAWGNFINQIIQGNESRSKNE